MTTPTSVFTLYRFYAADDTLLYVGLTVNPGKRMEKHAYGKPWWAEVARIAMEQHGSIEALREAERDAIKTEKPRHNVRMNQGTKAEQRQALRDNGWTRVSAYGAESWTHPNHPSVSTFTLAAAWTTAGIPLGRTPARSTLPQAEAPDGLIGRWFHSYRPLEEGEDTQYLAMKGGDVREWQGQIIDRDGDLFIAQLYSWWDGFPSNEVIVKAEDMKRWRFFATNEAMQIADGCSENDTDWQCRAPCTHVIRDWHGMGSIYRCESHIRHYSGKVEEL